MKLFDMDSKEDYLLNGKYMVCTPHAPCINNADECLNAVFEEMLNGYVDDDCMQTAVDCQVTINRIVWKLNQVYYGSNTEAYEDELFERLKARRKG